jgi:N-acetyl-anhydromuramyl-L-alanine amidase AmpD
MVGSYEGSMRWAQTNPHRTSFHYGIAQDGRIGQAVDEKWAAHHAGVFSWNLRSFGLEHEDKRGCETDPNWFTPKMFEASAKLAAHLCKKYGISPERIIPHRQVAPDGRSCPGPYFPLDRYKQRVRELLGGSGEEVWHRVKVDAQQVGAFKDKSNAESLVRMLAGLNVKARIESPKA